MAEASLADTLSLLRNEISLAQSQEGDVRFRITAVRVELGLEVRQAKNGGLTLNVLMASLAGSADKTSTQTHRLTLDLLPHSADGAIDVSGPDD